MESRPQLALMTLEDLNQQFNFDWNNYDSIAPNKERLSWVESHVTNVQKMGIGIEPGDESQLGELFFKIGAMYAHVIRLDNNAHSDRAITNLNKAAKYFADAGNQEGLDWANLHLAYAAQLKLAYSKKLLQEAIKNNDANAIERHKWEMAEHERDINLYLSKINSEYELESSDVNIEHVKISAFSDCIKSLKFYEIDELDEAIKAYELANKKYEKNKLFDAQWARALNRLAQMYAEQAVVLENNKTEAYGGMYAQSMLEKADQAFQKLTTYWAAQTNKNHPYAERHYSAAAKFYEESYDNDFAQMQIALGYYRKSHTILLATEGDKSRFTQACKAKIETLQDNLVKEILGNLITKSVKIFSDITDTYLRQIILENFISHLLARSVGAAGATLQITNELEPAIAAELNKALGSVPIKIDPNKEPNAHRQFFVYRWARQATSAGVIPAYRDAATGEIYIGLVCNKRNENMYNISAGYTQAPMARFTGKLQGYAGNVMFDRAGVIKSATKTMQKILDEHSGEIAALQFDYRKFQLGFQADNIYLPDTDIDSFHTATREAFEEMQLDLNKYENAPYENAPWFLISSYDMVGVSQGDAPGQLSNRCHQYLVYLGELSEAPKLTPGDDVVIADWVKVADINIDINVYRVNGKVICPHLIWPLEVGLKHLWNHLLQEASTYVEPITQEHIAAFSEMDNLKTYLSLKLKEEKFEEFFHSKQNWEKIKNFLHYLSANNLPNRSRVGKDAQNILQSILAIVAQLNPDKETKKYASFAELLLAEVSDLPTPKPKATVSLLYGAAANKSDVSSLASTNSQTQERRIR